MRALHLVLDASAVKAYAHGSEHVGEPLIEVSENGATFTAPATVLAAAASHVQPGWVDLLTIYSAFTPIDLEWSRWPALAATQGLVGRLDAADALLVAMRAQCDILTAEPALYAALGDDPPTITISHDD